jgi:hypothetical protein
MGKPFMIMVVLLIASGKQVAGYVLRWVMENAHTKTWGGRKCQLSS